MSDDGQQLLLNFQAQFERYNRQFERALQQTDQRFKALEKRSEQAASRMESTMEGAASRIGTALKGGIAGAVAGFTLAAFIDQARRGAAELAEIGRAAERAGVSAKLFQELGYVARQNGIEVDALTDGLKEMNLRADELIQTGAGPAAEAFHRLGISADDLKVKLRDPGAFSIGPSQVKLRFVAR